MANESKKVFFIINKYSGSGFQPKVEGRLLSFCEEANIEAVIEFTNGRGHATELAAYAAAAGDYRLVFAVGGDGTVNEVAQGLAGTTQCMSIIPKGSGNGLARHLGIPLDFIQSLQLLKKNRVIQMDTFRINNHLSINVSGVGFDGHIASMFGKDGKRGLVGYAKLVMNEFFSFKEFEGDLVIDGQPFRKSAFVIAFANSSQFGNNARVSPHASVCDEWLDVCIIKKIPMLQIIGFVQKMFRGQIEQSSFVEIIKAKEITASFSKLMAYHVDGEAMDPLREFTISVCPASLYMAVPPASKLV